MYLSQLETSDRKTFLELAHITANSDGVIVDQEIEILERYRDEMNLSHKEYEIQNISMETIIGELKSRSDEIKKIILFELMAIAFSDGIYDENQKQIMKYLQDSFEISPEEYEKLKELLNQLNQIYEKINSAIYAN